MERLENIIAKIPDAQVSPELKSRVLARIAEAREASYRLHRNVFGALATLGLVSLIPAVMLGVKEVSTSAFGSYISLLATDSALALSNWKVLLLSLVESAPIVGLTLALGAVFVFLASLKALAPYLKDTAPYSTAS